MILILYNQEIKNLSFIEYLRSQAVYINLLSFDQLKDSKLATLNGGNTSLIIKDRVIKLSEVTSIYNEIYCLTSQDFLDYIEADREYVCAEWTAYLMYFTQKYHKKTFNPFNHYILSGELMHLPYLYNTLKERGLCVPKIFLSLDIEELKSIFYSGKEYITLKRTKEISNFSRAENISENCIGLIESYEGDIVVVQIVGEQFFSCLIIDGKKIEYSLPLQYTTICLSFIQDLNLKLAEFIFKKTSNDLIFYRFSVLPRFLNNSMQATQDLYYALKNKLLEEAI